MKEENGSNVLMVSDYFLHLLIFLFLQAPHTVPAVQTCGDSGAGLYNIFLARALMQEYTKIEHFHVCCLCVISYCSHKPMGLYNLGAVHTAVLLPFMISVGIPQNKGTRTYTIAEPRRTHSGQ